MMCPEISDPIQQYLDSAKECSYQQGYDQGYDDAAKDPNAWYILDKDGNEAHLGDKFEGAFEHVYTIDALSQIDGNVVAIPLELCDPPRFSSSYIKKIDSDTREKVMDDLGELLGEFCDVAADRDDIPIIQRLWKDGKSGNDVANDFISRIEAIIRAEMEEE